MPSHRNPHAPLTAANLGIKKSLPKFYVVFFRDRAEKKMRRCFFMLFFLLNREKKYNFVRFIR